MLTNQEILDFCDRFRIGSSQDRHVLVSDAIARAKDPAYNAFAARIAILARDNGTLDLAESIIEPLLECPEYHEGAVWELGYAFGVSGQPRRAVEYLRRAVRSRPDPHWMLWLAVQHAVLKEMAQADDLLSCVERDHPRLAIAVKVHRQFFSLLARYDCAEAKCLLQEVRARFDRRSIAELEEEIRHALDVGKPYLMLRLGDGEGACIRLNAADESANRDYYRANREEFATIWFKDTAVLDDPEFSAAIDAFNAAIRQADAIGGSAYEAAIKVEYSHASRRGIAWVVNVMRKMLALAESEPEWATRVPVFSLVVHYDLLQTGALARLLRNRHHVGVISCHDELPHALAKTYDIEHVEFIKTPGEQIHAATLGNAAVAGRHWPDRYREICDELDLPVKREGQLWLVAAGILGKIYAGRLKTQGAVVIDIGAVADLWMGRNTRVFPELRSEAKLMIEDKSLMLIDVGGLGGPGEEWLPHLDRVRPILFEPNPVEAATARAKIAQARDGLVIERALGNRPERRMLYVTKSLGCSSLLDPNTRLLAPYTIAPAFAVTQEIEVDVVRFDSLLASNEVPQPDVVKIDVQGFEYQVLEGFGASLQSCLGVKIEAHLKQIYHDQKLFHDLIDLLGRAGLSLRRIEPIDHFDGDIIEVDAWFTCSIERLKSLSVMQAEKLAFLEQVWELSPRSNSFGAHQFD